uniref:Gag n=1 Tax=Gunnison's prairie dog retrovirus TaxID=2744145 RepID=A0A7D5B6K3_9RETR|nr:Gag [Gunnison's prairie dog retrovirus]
MGNKPAKARLANELKDLLGTQGTAIKSKTAEQFVEVIAQACPWFLTGGFLNNADWDMVKNDLQKILRDKGPNTFPIATFSLWRLVKDALITDKVKIKEQLAECEQILNQIQEEQMAESLKGEDPGETSKSRSKTRLKVQEEDFPEDSESLSEEEESLIKEIDDLECRIKQSSISSAASAPPPPPYNPNWDEDRPRPRAGVQWGPKHHGIFPMVEVQNAAGQPARRHEPLAFKDIKQLKEAVTNYGPHAPFTSTLFESFSANQLIPSDWQQLTRAALSPGDFLLWKSEFHERSRELAQVNAAAGHPQRNEEMLIGTGQYSTIDQQIRYDPAVYAQIATAAVHAWKSLPTSRGDNKISQITQGPSESYSDFIGRLMQSAGKIFPNLDQAMPLIKQLAYENANSYCQSAIKTSRARSIDDMIRACKDIDGAHITGQVLAAALKSGLQGMSKGTKCYRCGKEGHIKRNCAEDLTNTRRVPPGICPKCKKGNHWSSECRSKFDVQGNPIQSGNGVQGPTRGPKATVLGATRQWGSNGRSRRLPSANLFPSTTSPGEHQVVQDWTSVPPPEQY